VGGVDHLVGLGRRSVGLVDELPGVIEEVDPEAAMGRGVDVSGVGGLVGHEMLLSGADLGQVMEDEVEAVRARLDLRPMLRNAAALLGWVVAGQDGPDLVDRQLEVAQAPDGPGCFQLIPPITPVRRQPIDVGWPQDPELVVVAERPDRKPRQAREAPDRDQLVGALIQCHASIVDPRAGRESSPEFRHCRARRRSP